LDRGGKKIINREMEVGGKKQGEEGLLKWI
jgi:hypothetical protein